jgi:O-succinylbenzoate synthase
MVRPKKNKAAQIPTKMNLIATCKELSFDFRFEAGTSRGVLHAKKSLFVLLSHKEKPGIIGIGECGPLPGLSPDYSENLLPVFEKELSKIRFDNMGEAVSFQQLINQISADFPSLRFGFETALIDLMNGGKRILFESDFTKGQKAIPINGLVWMGPAEAMLAQVDDLVNRNFKCIKLKVGALDFESELRLLKQIRNKYTADKIELRLDANGAFAPSDAMRKLQRLSDFEIHSIEQPIKAGQENEMAKICRNSPIPIALDEELIGKSNDRQRIELLQKIKPHYIILKPSLIGGLLATSEWIDIAEQMGIGWWLTSALESNIGLNAISQFVASIPYSLPQGLGTGKLYHNNIPSPLSLDGPFMHYKANMDWDLSQLQNKDL